MPFAFTPEEISAVVQPRETRGATAAKIRNLASLESAAAGDLSFLANPKYKDAVPNSKASILLLPSDYPGQPPDGQLWLLLENPSVGITKLCRRLEAMLWPKPAAGVHPSAVVAAGAQVAASAHVGPLCVIEAGARVGENCVIESGSVVGRNAVLGNDCWLMARTVVAAECVLGARVRLQPGAVIGSDGYGYDTVNGRHEKIPQLGNVVLGDDVEIGANTTIDRARFSRTSIGEGTKVDNLVQIAHNCVIGKHCLIVAQVGIAGSTTIGDYVVIGGQAGIGGHLRIGSLSKIGGQAGVNRDLEPKSYVNGYYAIPYLLEQKFQVLRPKVPELFKRVARIEEQLGIESRKLPSS